MYRDNKFISFFSLFIFTGFILNLFWEYAHSPLYVPTYNEMLFICAIKDVLILLAIYFIIALLTKDLLWGQKVKLYPLLLYGLLGILVAAIIEYRAVFLLGKWSYSSAMPLVLGIGLSPLVQLCITGLFALAIIWIVLKK